MTKSVFESFSFSLKVKWSNFFVPVRVEVIVVKIGNTFWEFVEEVMPGESQIQRWQGWCWSWWCFLFPGVCEDHQQAVNFRFGLFHAKFFRFEVKFGRFAGIILKPTLCPLTFATFDLIRLEISGLDINKFVNGDLLLCEASLFNDVLSSPCFHVIFVENQGIFAAAVFSRTFLEIKIWYKFSGVYFENLFFIMLI